MDDKTLIKFIKNQGDDIFKKNVIRWVNASEENKKHFSMVKARYVAEFQENQAIDALGEHHSFKRRTQRSRQLRYGIAASITLFILVGSALFLGQEEKKLNDFSQSQLISTSSGEQRELILDDGSKVLLNSKSKLVISGDFNKENRTVKLLGEAFFEVTENKERPFIVETERGLQVKVLGTKFNVKAYENDFTTQTTLVSGKIEMYKTGEKRPLVTLKPKQKVIFHKKKKTIDIIDQVTTQKTTSWKEGVLSFDNTSFNQVAKDLERWYDVSIYIEDPSLEDYSFSGKFLRQYNVEQVLKIIETSSPIKYRYDMKNRKIEFMKGQ